MRLGSEFESVLDAARTGADWAWSKLYRACAPDLLGFLRSRTSEAEDVLGHVWLDVVEGLRRFSGDEPAFRAWIFTIASHRAIDAGRARRRRGFGSLDVAAHDANGPTGDTEEEAVENLVNAELVGVIRTLKPDMQDVLLLRVFGGFTVPEVGEILGKRIGTVKSLQRRALRRLGKIIAPDVNRNDEHERSSEQWTVPI